MTDSSSDLPDILIYCSDQHAAPLAGFMGDPLVRTPCLDALAAEGAVFTQAYTSCPLCVPARASFMTSRMPSSIGVFGNDDAFSSQHPTFAHCLAIRGYESVLCGRMHFIGEDQRHGFERRIADDFTVAFWGDPSEKRETLGDFGRTLYQKHCLEVIGTGSSPVLAYDDHVVDRALRYLEEPHDRPQMLLVGTYGPHFPYVAPPELFEHYRGKTLSTLHARDTAYSLRPVEGKRQFPSENDLDDLRAVYYAMVERMDSRIGMVRDAFRRHLRRSGRRGIFVYMSDHGDQIGEKGFFGKQTFFEYSAKIPLVIAADGCPPARADTPVSIMDIGPTICGLAGAPQPPLSEGMDQSAAVRGGAAVERPVLSEFFEQTGEGVQVGRMLRRDRHKCISYSGAKGGTLLFDLAVDPWEDHDVSAEKPAETKDCLRLLREAAKDDEAKARRKAENMENAARLAEWGALFRQKNAETWVPPPECRRIDDRFKHPEYRR